MRIGLKWSVERKVTGDGLHSVGDGLAIALRNPTGSFVGYYEVFMIFHPSYKGETSLRLVKTAGLFCF
jgi:hypothetical protein